MNAQTRELTWLRKPRKDNRQTEPREPARVWVKPERHWVLIHLDFAGPVKGMFLWLSWTIISSTTKIIPSLYLSKVMKMLRQMFASYGSADLVVFDNETAFASGEMQPL